MQLFFDVGKLIDESYLIDLAFMDYLPFEEYLAALKKKSNSLKLSLQEQSRIKEYDFMLSGFLDRGLTEKDFRLYYQPQNLIRNYLTHCILYELACHINIIDKYNIDRILLFFDKIPFPYFENIFKKQLRSKYIREFVEGFLNFTFSDYLYSDDDYWLAVPYLWDKDYDRINLQPRADYIRVLSEAGKRSAISILQKMEGRNRRSVDISKLVLTKADRYKILTQFFTAYYNSNIISPQNLYSDTLTNPTYYFIDDLKIEHKDALRLFPQTIGISIEDGSEYDSNYFKIFEKLTNLKFAKSTQCLTYDLPLLKIIDETFELRLDKLLNNNKKPHVLFIKTNDNIIKNKIIVHCEKRTGLTVKNMQFNSTNSPTSFAEGIYLVDNLNSHSESMLVSYLNKINSYADKNILIIILGSKAPRLIKQKKPYDLDYSSWSLNEEIISKNISRVFHSFLNDVTNNTIDKSTFDLINKNMFNEIIDYKYNSLDPLFQTIKYVSNNYGFDYKSCKSWYYFLKTYKDRCKSMDETVPDSTESSLRSLYLTIRFDSKKKKWQIFGLDENPIEEDPLKPILYAVLTIMYFNKKQKGIKYSDLCRYSDIYDKLMGTYRQRQKKDDPTQTIYSAFGKKSLNGIDSTLFRKFLHVHFKRSMGQLLFINYLDDIKINCKCEIENINVDEALFSGELHNTYIEL